MPHPDPSPETQTADPGHAVPEGARSYLLVIHGNSSSRVPLPHNGMLVVGRSPEVDIPIDDAAISRRHARFIVARDDVRVADLGSHNGTRVNDERIEGSRTLVSGDVVTIGDAMLILHVGARAAAGPPAPSAAAAAGTIVRHTLGERTILAADPAMVRLFDLIRKLAASDLPVLVLGETGAGKENAASAVHFWSARAAGPLVTFNCATIPETLVDGELFGHEKGAFSGAAAAKPGLFERASGGTVFFDEVGELPASTQAKLLRALEVKRITRLGDVREREIDVRVVAATNRDLEAECRAGRFRRDLLFRLGAATVHLPPLRHRPREVPILARMFLADACARAGRPPLNLSEAALRRLADYEWPGNVRELKNAIEYAVATLDGNVVEPWDLPYAVAGRSAGEPPTPPDAPERGDAPASGAPASSQEAPSARRFQPITEEIRELERTRIQEALDATDGAQRRAAELIGMPLRTFVLKLKQYGLQARDTKRRP